MKNNGPGLDWTASGFRGSWREPADYDEAGRLKSIVAPTGDSVRLSFDAQNRLTAVTYCSGNGLSFGYDKEGRIASMADGGGRLCSFDYT